MVNLCRCRSPSRGRWEINVNRQQRRINSRNNLYCECVSLMSFAFIANNRTRILQCEHQTNQVNVEWNFDRQKLITYYNFVWRYRPSTTTFRYTAHRGRDDWRVFHRFTIVFDLPIEFMLTLPCSNWHVQLKTSDPFNWFSFFIVCALWIYLAFTVYLCMPAWRYSFATSVETKQCMVNTRKQKKNNSKIVSRSRVFDSPSIKSILNY